MNVINIIRIYYTFLTVYLILNATTLSFMMVLPAVLLMWVNYGMFRAGCKGLRSETSSRIVIESHFPYRLSRGWMILIIVLSVLFSILVVRFYTGQTVGSVVTSLASKESLYWQYQKHFLENELGVLALRKAPYILMMFCLKLFLIYSFVTLSTLRRPTTLGEKIFLLIVSLSYLFISAARGTSFELFEVFSLILYSVTAGSSLSSRLKVLGNRKMLWIGFLGICFLFLFSYQLNERGDFGGYATQEIRYDPNAFLSHVAPPFAWLSSALSGYFGFGFYYTSVVISKIWLVSIESFFAGLVPFGFSMIGIESFSQGVCGIIDCGAAWRPDVTLLINRFGFFGVLFFCFFIGRFFHYINSRKSVNQRIVTGMTNFMIMMQMLSLPVGNFVLTSSSNKLVVCFLVALWLRYWLKSGRFIRVVRGKGVI